MQILKTRRWDSQLFVDSQHMPWAEALARFEQRVLDALIGPWGRYP